MNKHHLVQRWLEHRGNRIIGEAPFHIAVVRKRGDSGIIMSFFGWLTQAIVLALIGFGIARAGTSGVIETLTWRDAAWQERCSHGALPELYCAMYRTEIIELEESNGNHR